MILHYVSVFRCDEACYLQFSLLPLSLLSQIIHAIICPLAATPSARLLFFWKYFTRSGRKRRGESYYHDIASLRQWANCQKRNMWVILFIILGKYTSSEKWDNLNQALDQSHHTATVSEVGSRTNDKVERERERELILIKEMPAITVTGLDQTKWSVFQCLVWPCQLFQAKINRSFYSSLRKHYLARAILGLIFLLWQSLV